MELAKAMNKWEWEILELSPTAFARWLALYQINAQEAKARENKNKPKGLLGRFRRGRK